MSGEADCIAQDRKKLKWLKSEPWAGDGECGDVSLTAKN